MNITNTIGTLPLFVVLLASAVAGCGGGGGGESGPTLYTISGTVTGLAAGNELVLQNNDGDDLVITANGDFSFTTTITAGQEYNVTVLTNPANPVQTCVVSGGEGTTNQNITSVLVTCTTNTYTISGTVSGLAGTGLVLQNNSGDDLSIDSDGGFSFVTAVESGSTYNVSVSTQPVSLSQTCEVSNGNGNVFDQAISDITVTCTTNTYTVGGTVTGLIGSGLTLRNNGGDDLLITANGGFSFLTPVLSGDNFNVTIETHPDSPSQTCEIGNSAGTLTDSAINSIVVSCSTYQVGVTVTGLEAGETLTLQNNGGDDLLITGNGGPFVFDTLIYDLFAYNVTVSVQPSTSNQQCMVANGVGMIPSQDVLDIRIVCPNVSALYPANGSNWNDYVNNTGANGFTADDTACAGSGNSYASCLHGGEMRSVVLDGVNDCADLTAEDDLNAFNWSCDDSTGSARLISTNLKDSAAFSSLIDFVNTQWLENAVTVKQSGVTVAKTPLTTWWSNSFVVANAGGSLDAESTIYLVTADPSASYTVDADRVGIVVQPDVEISSSVSSSGYAYLWVEGSFNAGPFSSGISIENVTHSVVSHSEVRGVLVGGVGGIVLQNSDNNLLANSRVVSSGVNGVVLDSSSYNMAVNLVAVNSNMAGVFVSGSNRNLFSNVIAANNDLGNTASGGGIAVYGSNDNTFINSTVVNNTLSGIATGNSPNSLLMNTMAANNYTAFYITNSSDYLTLANSVATNNARHGVYVNDVSNNYFTGVLKVGGNGDYDCRFDGSGTAPGLIFGTCTDTGVNGSSVYTGQLSDAVLSTNVTAVNSFVGKLFSDDSVNISDLNGGGIYSAITDWAGFENRYRVWSLDGDNFPAITHRGPFPYCENFEAYNEADCLANSGTWRSDGRIWDWSLASGDDGDNGEAVAMEVLSFPSGDDVITHTWSDSSSTKFLRNAVEILGDAIGNDNGLCESNEACQFTPNIGAYQGHGRLVESTQFQDSVTGGITGVRLFQYETNGY